MHKVITVVGNRPQFIKLATVSRLLRQLPDIQDILIHTGQHYDANMSSVFFDELELPQPNYHFAMTANSQGQQTGEMLIALEPILQKEKPDLVLVYGDTNSTLAGCLAAVKLKIPVLHVEAGLRSFNRQMPEEINRCIVDAISDYLLTPTDYATQQLRRENIPESRIFQVGDVMFDAVLFYAEKAKKQRSILKSLGLSSKNYVLSTIHRAENTDDDERLHRIFDALSQLSSHIPVVLPLHPRTQKKISAWKKKIASFEKLILIEPVGYFDMLQLENEARLIVTDSGGVQKEAYFFQVPCVTLRDETEWTELIDLGWNQLLSPHHYSAHEIFTTLYQSLELKMGKEGHPFGEGKASQKIVGIIQQIFKKTA